MNKKYRHLLSPYKISGLEIKNRFTLSAMGIRNFDAKGCISNEGIHYFTQFAKGGFGLIISASFATDTEIDTNRMVDRISPRGNQKNFILSCTEMNDRIHAYGTKIFGQISLGVGRNGMFKSASPLPSYAAPDFTVGQLSIEEIKRKIEMEIEGAVICQKAGFDGVEIHALHYGYLLDQFAMTLTNHRTDEYGGCLENRLRIAKEVVAGIKQVCGSNYPVTMRLGLKSFITGLGKGHSSLTGENEAGRTIEEGIAICRELETYGYDALSCDVGVYESWYHQTPPMYIPKLAYLPLAEQAKRAVHIPVIMSNRMNDPDLAEKAIAEGKIDAIAIGRAALADPDFPNKVAKDRTSDIRPCLSCCQCIDMTLRIGGVIGCTVNPSITRELAYGIKKTAEPKKLVVIGGGVAGMAAALTAKLSGHEVILYEASHQLGGNLIPAALHRFKQDVWMLNEWFQRQLFIKGVEIKLNTKVDPGMVKQMGADVIIESTGAVPVIPRISGYAHPKSVSCMEVLTGEKKAGNKVTIIGGGLVGCEMAVEYAMEGKDVTIVESLNSILASGAPIPMMQDMMIRDLIPYYNIKVFSGHRIIEVNDTGALIESTKKTKDKKIIETDTVVFATGFKPRPSMRPDLLGEGIDVYTIGDANRIGSIKTAVWDAYEVARNL